MTVTAPTFNECAVKQICASLPKDIDQRRLDLLPQVLDEWSRTELREHLSRESRATVRTRNNRLKKVKNCATRLRQALEAIDQRGMSWIAQEIGREEGHELFSVSHEKLTEMKERLREEGEFLLKLAAATPRLTEEIEKKLSTWAENGLAISVHTSS
jgi:hypothetical protein